MEGPSQSSQNTLCRNGCGFYGSSKNDGMCSVCYKNSIQKKNNSGRKSPGLTHMNSPDKSISSPKDSVIQSDGVVANAMASLTTDNSSTIESSPSVAATATQPIAIPTATTPANALTSPSTTTNSSFNEASSSLDDSASSPSKPKKNRCTTCRKRLGLTGFYCRCGQIFCSLHRYSDQHACEFDYKADAQAKIRKENPVVVGEKINKI